MCCFDYNGSSNKIILKFTFVNGRARMLVLVLEVTQKIARANTAHACNLVVPFLEYLEPSYKHTYKYVNECDNEMDFEISLYPEWK